jgi:hypothetical protein
MDESEVPIHHRQEPQMGTKTPSETFELPDGSKVTTYHGVDLTSDPAFSNEPARNESESQAKADARTDVYKKYGN